MLHGAYSFLPPANIFQNINYPNLGFKTIEKAQQKANLKVGELLHFIKRCYQTQSFAFQAPQF
jgi:hypothetical protein